MALWVATAPWIAAAQEQKRQPPPEFSSGYQLPAPTVPPPRAEWLAWIDVGVLLLGLILASYIVLVRRSRIWLLVLALFSAAYFGLYRQGCVCSVGSVQNVALALTSPGYALSVSVAAFFLLPLLFAIFYGRVFCSAVCPLGALQELVLWRPLRVPETIAGPLGLIPFLYLGLAVLFAATGAGFVVCRYDPWIAAYRLGTSPAMGWVTAGFLFASVFVGRPYCRFLCPYGALLRMASWLAAKPARIAPSKCVSCHLCPRECPYGAIRPPTIAVSSGLTRFQQRRILVRRLLYVVPLVALLGTTGWLAGPILARLHPTFSLAQELAQSSATGVRTRSLALEAHHRLGNADEQVVAEALRLRAAFQRWGAVWGAWIGLVCGAYAVSLGVRWRRSEYIADPGTCVACARCFSSCPVLPSEVRP